MRAIRRRESRRAYASMMLTLGSASDRSDSHIGALDCGERVGSCLQRGHGEQCVRSRFDRYVEPLVVVEPAVHGFTGSSSSAICRRILIPP